MPPKGSKQKASKPKARSPKTRKDAWGLPIRFGGPAWGRRPQLSDVNTFGIDIHMMLTGKRDKGGKTAENPDVPVHDAAKGSKRSLRKQNEILQESEVVQVAIELEANVTKQQSATSARSLRKRKNSDDPMDLKNAVLSKTPRKILSPRRQALQPKPSISLANQHQSTKDVGVAKGSGVATKGNSKKRPADDSEDQAQPKKQKTAQGALRLPGLRSSNSKPTKDVAGETDVAKNSKKRKVAEDEDEDNQAQSKKQDPRFRLRLNLGVENSSKKRKAAEDPAPENQAPPKKQKITLRMPPVKQPENTVINGTTEWTKPPRDIRQHAQKMTRTFATPIKDISMFRIDFCDMRDGKMYRKVFAHQDNFDFANRDDRVKLNKWRGNIYSNYTDSGKKNDSTSAVAAGSATTNTGKEATTSAAAAAVGSSRMKGSSKIAAASSSGIAGSSDTNVSVPSKGRTQKNDSTSAIGSDSSRTNTEKEATTSAAATAVGASRKNASKGPPKTATPSSSTIGSDSSRTNTEKEATTSAAATAVGSSRKIASKGLPKSATTSSTAIGSCSTEKEATTSAAATAVGASRKIASKGPPKIATASSSTTGSGSTEKEATTSAAATAVGASPKNASKGLPKTTTASSSATGPVSSHTNTEKEATTSAAATAVGASRKNASNGPPKTATASSSTIADSAGTNTLKGRPKKITKPAPAVGTRRSSRVIASKENP